MEKTILIRTSPIHTIKLQPTNPKKINPTAKPN